MVINPLTYEINNYKKGIILSNFPYLKSCATDYYLSIERYINSTPEKFLSEKAFTNFFNFLNVLKKNDSSQLSILLNDYAKKYLLAFKNLSEINKLKFHDIKTPSDEFDLIQLCEEHINPNYLKLIEGVYSNFLFPISAHLLLIKNKQIDGLDTFNIVEVIKGSKYGFLAEYYNNIIRNAIAHGKVIYKQNTAIFEDKKGNLFTTSLREYINYFDNILDICNGFALGLHLFYLTNIDFIEYNNIEIPIPILIEELKANLNLFEWEIKGCIESQTLDERSQLIVFIYHNFFDRGKIFYFLLQTAIISESIIPGYDRYFLYLNSKYHIPNFAAFKGGQLKKIRIKNTKNIADYSKAIESGSILFTPKFKLPKIFSIIFNSILLFKIILPLRIREIEYFQPKLTLNIRDLEMHKNEFHSVINSRIIINTHLKIHINKIIRKYCGYIIKRVTRMARKRVKITNISKYLPLGFIRISLYEKDFRLRKLGSAGIIPELICTLEIKTLKRIKAPDIIGGIPEWVKNIKIVWNSKSKLITTVLEHPKP